jgi:signal transduction histidine kinase
MEITTDCPVAAVLAARIRASRDELTARWLERIAARVQLEPERIFPTDELLDHVPILMDGIAAYVEDPSAEITADIPLIAKAMELGKLRFGQGFDASEILKEYEILGGILFAFSAGVMEESGESCAAAEVFVCSHRIFRAISVIEQVATAQYLRALGERVGEREERLRRFNRMITHELKNRVGATLGAGQLLQEEWLGEAERRRFAGMVADNAQAIQKVLENLVALSRLDGDRRRQRNIALPEVVAEVFRQLRELARARQVDLRVTGELPDVEVNAAAFELCLSNYLSNSIKYSDPAAAERWAAVEARIEPESAAGEAQLVLCVRDNGLGVPAEHRDRLFERFFRGHAETTAVEGTGLGLSLVRETVEAMGGRVWAEHDATDGGTVFAFSMPCRRDAESPLSPGPGAAAPRAGGARSPTDAGRERASD